MPFGSSKDDEESDSRESRPVGGPLWALLKTFILLCLIGGLVFKGFAFFKKLPNKPTVQQPAKETWEEVKAKAERNLRGEK